MTQPSRQFPTSERGTKHTPESLPWEWASYGSMKEDKEDGGFRDKYASVQIVPVNAERKGANYRYDDCVLAFYVDHYQESEWKIPSRANAAYIVKACNAYPKLVEKLRECVIALQDEQDAEPESDNPIIRAHARTQADALAVLAEIEKGTMP